MKKYLIVYTLGWLMILIFYSCKKMVSTMVPPNQLTPEKVFSNNESAVAATLNLYTLLSTLDNFTLRAGAYTDELDNRATDATALEFFSSVLTPDNAAVKQIWQNLFFTIYRANAVVEGVEQSKGLADSVKNQCLGEARFIRALSNFYLVNIFGDIPLATTTSVGMNARSKRSSTAEVYAQIVSDLTAAQSLLPDNFSPGTAKVRAGKWAATALLSRVYLYLGDWTNAEAQSSTLIGSGKYSLSSNLNNVFLSSSTEVILQLWNSSGISSLGTSFIPASGAPLYPLSADLLNSFESSDQRKVNWTRSTTVSGVTYYYPFKYKQRSSATGSAIEYSVYLRLAEQYLNRAEARAQQNKLSEALADLNIIRSRAGLTASSAVLKDDILDAIAKERRTELFTESGHRFFDLKRTGRINTALKPIKPLWQPTASLFPIPHSELLMNSSLVQNPGYN